MMLDINYCYQGGDLDKALVEAADFVKEIGEVEVEHVYATHDEETGGWTVNVVYNREPLKEEVSAGS
jgi:hypothetical protein